MTIRFSKMHGLGNDFVVIDAVNQPISLDADSARLIADRRFGVGCDQILLVEPPRSDRNAFHYRIFNADGGEVEQCGNGARCFARFVYDKEMTSLREIPVGTASGDIVLELVDEDSVRVNMGAPMLEPAGVPFIADGRAIHYSLSVDGETLEIGVASMGNPHAVLQVSDPATAPVERLGPLIETHPDFPQRTNVGFMAVRSAGEIDLRVFERGTGETLACGTGACAAVVVGRIWGVLDERVRVNLPGGSLVISWQGEEEPVWMTGPAVLVYDGEIDLDQLPRPGGKQTQARRV